MDNTGKYRPGVPIRKKIFKTLVKLQDEGMKVKQSYHEIASIFDIPETTDHINFIKKVEAEGIVKCWPPFQGSYYAKAYPTEENTRVENAPQHRLRRQTNKVG